jgi:hypothetical protein
MQTSRNIVLSEHAKADAIPNLEIEANDVAVRARGERRAGRRRGRSSTSRAVGSRARRPSG